MFSGTRVEDTRIYNRKIIVEAIRCNGPISRAELARLTGLTTATVSNLISELMGEEIVLQKGRRKGQRGQPAIELDLNPNGRFAIGFELGRDNLSGVALNLTGDILGQVYQEWQYPPPETAIPMIAEQVQSLIASTGIAQRRLLGVGVAMPGPFLTDRKNVVFPINFPHWEGFPIWEALTEALGLEVTIENDVMAAAIGEYFHGEGRLYANFFYLYLGTGLGGAMILKGHPYRGFSPNTGEIGRIRYPAKGREALIGHFLGLNHLYEYLQQYGLHVADPQAVAALFDEHNPHLMDWLNEAVECVDLALNAANYLLGPEAIFLGGRFPAQVIDYLVKRVQIESNTLRPFKEDPTILHQVKLLRATFGELASALGAATLPLYQAFSVQDTALLPQNTGSNVT